MRTVCLGVLLAVMGLGPASAQILAEDAVAKTPVAAEAGKEVPAEAQVAPTDRSAETGDQGAGEATQDVAKSEPTSAPSAQPADQAAQDRRDPFRPFLRKEAPGEAVESEGVGVTAYELRQLKLVGVLVDMAPPRALLQDNSGMGYVVTPGARVGRHGGVVATIEAGRMVVEEKRVDFYGREQLTREVLEIAQDIEPQEVGRE